jgi:hypothetical protein
MTRHSPIRKRHLAVETLEGRALLSGTSHLLPSVARAAAIGGMHASAVKTTPAGTNAVLNAMFGGMGSEFVTLIRNQVHNLGSVLGGFVSGRLTQYSISGLTVKTPTVQPQFVGQTYDQLLPTAAGALLLKGNVVELGAIMRGPFHDPSTSYYVFALNRGAGASLGPTFPARPGITPDALVTLAVGPYGSSATGTITDLANHTTQAIAPSNIKIIGPTVRVFLNASQFPPTGWPIQKYRFAFWTQTQPGNDITTVADFAPESSMIPIGMLKNVAAVRFTVSGRGRST